MNSILFKENLISGYDPLCLDIISFLAILSSILVITTTNPVISVLFLIGLFINVAIYLMLLGITFIGLTYIIVYVGAVTILFLFVIMLLNIKLSELYQDNSDLPYGTIIGIIFLYPLFSILPNNYLDNSSTLIDAGRLFNWLNSSITNLSFNYKEIKEEKESLSFITDTLEQSKFINLESNLYTLPLDFKEHYNYESYKAMTNLWNNTLFEYTQISSIGHIMYSSHLIWFFVVSLILLLAMVGSISLTLKSTSNT